MSEVDWDVVAAEYRAGATLGQLGRRWGRHPSNIWRAMTRRGIDLEDGAIRRARGLARYVVRRKAAARQRHLLVRTLYEQGLPIAEIARASDYAASTVRQLVAAQRADYRARDARVLEIYQAGYTTIETAQLTGVQPTQVGRIIQRAGISRRPGPRSRAEARSRPIALEAGSRWDHHTDLEGGSDPCERS